MRKLSWMVCAAAALLSTSAFAAKGSWKTLSKRPYVIKSREVPRTQCLETWVEGRIDAPPQDVQAALLDIESHPAFMPYVKLSKQIGEPAKDGSVFVYTRLAPPVVSARDYVVKSVPDSLVKADGIGEFRLHWESAGDEKVRPIKGVVRVKKNSGSWHVRPQPDGSSLVTYAVVADTGVNIPGFIANRANRNAMNDMMKALQREAQRRHTERAKAVAAADAADARG